MTDQIHQVRRILAIVDGEAGRKPDRFGIFAQQPRAYGVERPGPGEPLGHRAVRAAKLKQDQVDPADHFRRRAPGKRQQHHASRIGALPDQPRHPMRQRRGLAGTSAGDDEQRSRLGQWPTAMLDGTALLRIELFQARRRHGTESLLYRPD